MDLPWSVISKKLQSNPDSMNVSLPQGINLVTSFARSNSPKQAYLLPDIDRFYIFDSISAQIWSKGVMKKRISLKSINSTKHDLVDINSMAYSPLLKVIIITNTRMEIKVN
jgi:hypothetical protein